jgi:hypothetical protein
MELLHPPIFIGGLRRTGTTLMRKILGSHSQIALLPNELNYFERITDWTVPVSKEEREKTIERVWNNLTIEKKKIGISKIDVINRMTNTNEKDFWRGLLIAILDEYRKNTGKDICGDKSPLYEFSYVRLQEWFSNTGLFFIHMVRNPIDSYVSQVYRFGNSKESIVQWCIRWNKSISLAICNSSLFPNTYTMVRFEDALNRTEEVIERICAMLGVEPEVQRMMDMVDYDWQKTDNSSFSHVENSVEHKRRVRKTDSIDR